MCDELSRRAAPRLRDAGFAPPQEPFSRDTLKYAFTRGCPDGVQVLEILFNKYRTPEFSVQIYLAPASGVTALAERGGALRVGCVSSAFRRWPLPVRSFRAEPTRLQRMLGHREDGVTQAVQRFLSLLPEIEEWWTHQQPTRHIVVGPLSYPGANRKT